MTNSSLITLLLLSWCCTLSKVAGQFSQATVLFSSQNLYIPLDINVTFTTNRVFYPNEVIILKMPRFTRRNLNGGKGRGDSVTAPASQFNIPMGELVMSPSISFEGSWTEGHDRLPNDIQQEIQHANVSNTPFSDSYYTFQTMGGMLLPSGTSFTLAIYKVNGISAYCGFPGSIEFSNLAVSYRQYETVQLTIQTNLSTTLNANITGTPFLKPRTVDLYLGMGTGCKAWNKCNGHGACDYCLSKCFCNQGYGMWNDTVVKGRNIDPSCLQRTCPVGKSIVDVPSAYNKAHAVAECSDRGLCDRSTGQCTCFPPFTGAACERMSCPNDCSGHGQCLSMKELALAWAQRTPSYFTAYGQANYQTSAWDWDVMYGCFCDSSWPVGYEAGETQLGEFFGPDCSLRRCPSGKHPHHYNYIQHHATHMYLFTCSFLAFICPLTFSFLFIPLLSHSCLSIFTYEIKQPGNNPYSQKIETDCYRKTQTIDGIVAFHGGPYNGKNPPTGEKGNICHIDCSNRGVCDYSSGACTCFPGSWGDNCAQLTNAGHSHEDYPDYDPNNRTVEVLVGLN